MSWQLQCLELEALIKKIKELQHESFIPEFETMRKEYQKQLKYNRDVLETWEQNESLPFIPIKFR